MSTLAVLVTTAREAVRES
ncbi:hypothetical protein E2C01_072196 [Portunus trituberculatus]|uniref:Uncharacterized protein n=1 Tax=Portunus trituberculatus TaxID=210409 RepID=A0A5B7I1Z8_PORTR|nr:hypothetical protein [Portunus trituberculatus]